MLGKTSQGVYAYNKLKQILYLARQIDAVAQDITLLCSTGGECTHVNNHCGVLLMT